MSAVSIEVARHTLHFVENHHRDGDEEFRDALAPSSSLCGGSIHKRTDHFKPWVNGPFCSWL
jgi:hypothetical protein